MRFQYRVYHHRQLRESMGRFLCPKEAELYAYSHLPSALHVCYETTGIQFDTSCIPAESTDNGMMITLDTNLSELEADCFIRQFLTTQNQQNDGLCLVMEKLEAHVESLV